LGTVGEAGIGLGLAIVERIARVINVEIEVRSERGRGSRFRLIFPPSAPSHDQYQALAPLPPTPPASDFVHPASA
jgi:K+-sensing histidine kinase KdpD